MKNLLSGLASLAGSASTRLWGALIAIALLALALWIGYSAAYSKGWNARDAQVSAQRIVEADKRLEILQKNTADTQARDAATIAQLEQVNASSASRMQALTARLKKQQATPYVSQENPHDPLTPPRPPLLGQSVLDDGTVSLLDNARRGNSHRDPGGAPAGGHEEGDPFTATAPYVTGLDFAQNDLEVVRLYHVLATRHSDLVDWVNQQCSPQARNKP